MTEFVHVHSAETNGAEKPIRLFVSMAWICVQSIASFFVDIKIVLI